MPKRKKPVKCTPKKSNVTKKVENDILRLLQNQKRSCTVSEIIISDDSSDFVVNDVSRLDHKDVVELPSKDISKPSETIDWFTAVKTVIQESDNVKSQDKDYDEYAQCENAAASTAETVLLDPREQSASPDLFECESDPERATFQGLIHNNGASTPKRMKKKYSEPLQLQVDIDPFSIFSPTSDTTTDENNSQYEVTPEASKETKNLQVLNGKRDNTDNVLNGSPKLRRCESSPSVSQRAPNVVVLDGVKKQSTITSFFGGKASKPTLTFVDDPPKTGALKEKAVKLKTIEPENDLEFSKTVVKGPRTCPFYKKIPGTNFVVDAFSYGVIPGVQYYFLSHFHSDHYQGLNKHFRKPIFCTQVTANLVALKLRVYKSYLNVLPLNVATRVEEVEVTPIEANHCPGAAMFIFHFPKTGQRILHTGDFRFHRKMTMATLCPPLQNKIHQLFLDTTYLNPKYNFPLQEDVIDFVKNVLKKEAKSKPRVLVVCGSYTIGKEKVFMAAAEVLNCMVWTSPEKRRVLNCLEDSKLQDLLTLKATDARVHVLPMQRLGHPQLRTYLSDLGVHFDSLIAFKPTGWTYSPGKTVTDMKPSVQGNIQLYSVPYSEHSSFGELEQFVRFLKPNRVIPTVNIGSPKSRSQMDLHIQKWLKSN